MSSEQSYLISEGMKRFWSKRKSFKCIKCHHLSSHHREIYVNFDTGKISLGSNKFGHACEVKNCDCKDYSHPSMLMVSRGTKK